MATSVNAALAEFMKNSVNLDPEQTKAARASRDWLRSQIAGFPVADDTFPRPYSDVDILLGSFHRRTKIRPLDDVDLIFGLSAESSTYSTYADHIRLNVSPTSTRLLNLCHDGVPELNSKKVLNRFVSALAKVPQYRRADIGRDGEAVVVSLASYPWSFDVVPAFFTKPEVTGRTFYLIPDGNGHWKKTDPRIDEQRVSSVNQRHGGRVLPCIRLLKYWNKRRTVPTVRSYVLESMIVTHYEQKATAASDNVDIEFASALGTLAVSIIGAVPDPKEIQGDLNSLSQQQRYELAVRARADVALVEEALVAERAGDHRSAMARWRQVVGDEFSGVWMTSMNETQAVHSYFRGAAEVSKWCRSLAFILEVAAAVVVLRGMLTSVIEAWLPVLSFFLLAGSAVLRLLAGRYKDYSDYCRRVSMRAFASGRDIPVNVSSGIRSDAPRCSLRLAAKLPAYTLQQYYEAQAAPGEARLRELYAYSSFYSSQLMKTSKYLYGAAAVVVLIVAVLVLYSLVQSESRAGRELVTDALFSVVLSVVGLRLMEEALAFTSAGHEVLRVADSLIAPPLPAGDDLKDLAFQYEAQMSSAPSISTSIYRIRRRGLDDAWRHRRHALT